MITGELRYQVSVTNAHGIFKLILKKLDSISPNHVFMDRVRIFRAANFEKLVPSITQTSMGFANKMAPGVSEGILCAEHESGL